MSQRWCLLLLPLLWVFGAQAETAPKLGFPYIQNYTKQQYQAGNQNWSIARGADGVMYYGNSSGLLAYDGSSWQLHRLPNKQIVRAVATDGKGRVYVGGFEEMGYWRYDDEGRFRYTSLIGLVPEEQRPKEEIWKIYTDKDQVYFQSFGSIYRLQNGKVDVIKAKQPYLFLHKAGKRFFAEVLSEGLYELKADSLYFIKGSKALGSSGVLAMLPFGQESYLIGTAKDGLFLYDGHTFSPWQNEANGFLRKYQLNNGVSLPGGNYAFGTILNGVVVLNRQGELVHQLNKSSGLQNNTVLNLYPDAAHNLWVGLDNGIDRVELNSPLYFYFDKTGSFGTVYSSIIHGGKIYLGTNQGLYYSNWEADNTNAAQRLDFRMIPNSQGQVWELSLQDGELLCGHNEGTFRVEGSELVKISDVKGGWMIKKLSSHPTALMQGTYNGLVIYRKDKQGHWAYSHTVQGFGEASKNVEQDQAGYIWVSHPYKGLYRLRLSPDLQKVEAMKSFNASNGLSSMYKVSISRLFNRLLFSTGTGFYRYSELSDRFMPYKELNSRIGSLATANRILPASGSTYWFVNSGKISLVDLENPKQPQVYANQFSILDGRMVQGYECISRISDTNYLISIDDGFVIYNTGNVPEQRTPLPKVLVRRVENAETPQQLQEVAHRNKRLQVPFAQNSMRFSFALPYFRHAQVEYQYKLEGYTGDWSAWSAATQKEFTNLGPGTYSFKVRARLNGKDQTDVSEYMFEVLPPWYATWWAYTMYALLAMALLWLARNLYFRKLQRDQLRIQRKLEQEKQEHLRQEALQHEQKLVKLRNEQLKAELSSKSRELASTALNIVNKNEMLQSIGHELNKLQDADGNRLPEKQLRKIQNIISDGMTSRNDWELFEKSFNETNANYFKKLKEGYPELTPNDLKLCAYLRMNMSSKEIASLLNITVRGVELRRYRLRKKLNMDPEKSLVEFVMEM
ncbi:transcriptional regulator [Pontibacter mangrovi]|uniref:Transcriptional regulator n=2 Tax=Pontibacter mangrovi TaxID=2589816 RepID=A0A501W3P1_9BACT|nr:transcriptional regulator [Pontibacter mangrovi]